MLYDAGPILRAHQVGDLPDRILLLRKLVWWGEAAFNRRLPPVGGLRDPKMREYGLAITEGCQARNDMCELAAIYEFVKTNIRYTGDITNKDTFQSAYRTMQYAGGDCDDMFTLCAVLAMENGFQTRARITSNTGATWDHIFCMAGIPKHEPRRWIALDTTLPGRGKFNTQPPYTKFKDFDTEEA